MSRSDVESFGLLDAWPRVMDESPFRFNQILGAGVIQRAGCPNDVYVQAERDLIANALHQSVMAATNFLRYYPRPVWIADEIIHLDDTDWDKQTLRTRYGYLHQFASERVVLVQAGATVTYSDSDLDGIADKATLTVNYSTPDIRLYFQVSDGAPSAAHPAWRIHELNILSDGAAHTVTGHKGLFVHPTAVWAKRYASLPTREYAGDSTTAGDFVTAVDVYALSPKTSEAVIAEMPDGSEIELKAEITDSRFGTFKLAVKDEEPECNPVRVRVSYEAGYPLSWDGRMSPVFERNIIRYANTLMPKQPGALCERGIVMWSEDLGVLDAALQDPSNQLQNRFTLAAHELWGVIKIHKNDLPKNPGGLVILAV